MYKQLVVVLTFGIGLALSSASCVTCPAGQQSCGDSYPSPSAGSAGAAGAAGTAGTAGTAGCSALTAMKQCMTAFCATASNPYCTCYKRGFDLGTDTCKCVDFDAQGFCEDARRNGIDATSYDCAAASSGVSSICVGVN